MICGNKKFQILMADNHKISLSFYENDVSVFPDTQQS